MKDIKKQIFLVILTLVLMAQVRPGSAQSGTCGVENTVFYTVTGEDTEQTITFTAGGPEAEWDAGCKELIQTYQPKTVNVIVNDNAEKIRLSDGAGAFSGSFGFVEAMDLSGWDTGNVANMASMFEGCSALTTLDLGGWNTGNVTNMASMFKGCSSLTVLDLSGWNLKNRVSMANMFENCSALTDLYLYSWNTGYVSTMGEMFKGCDALATLCLGTHTLQKAIFDSLPEDLYNADWYYVNGDYGYQDSSLGTRKSGDDLFKPARPDDSGGRWSRTEGNYTCGVNVKPEYTPLEEGGYALSFHKQDQNADAVFGHDCRYFIRKPLPDGANEGDIRVVNIVDPMGVQNRDANSLFFSLRYVESMDLSKLDVSAVSDMEAMFCGSRSLKTLDLSGWSTGNVKNMHSMFEGCRALADPDVSRWDTSHVTDMRFMFNNCSALTMLDLSGWNIINVGNMQAMFAGCSALTILDLSGWYLKSGVYMAQMFQNCSALADLYLNGWNTNNLNTEGAWDNMFTGCSTLATLSLGSYTLKRPIFDSLPEDLYNADWYYVNGYYGNGSVSFDDKRSGDALFKPADPGDSGGRWSRIAGNYTCGRNVKPEYTQLDGTGCGLSFQKQDPNADAAYGPDCRFFISYPLPDGVQEADIWVVNIGDPMGVQGRSTKEMFANLMRVESMDLSQLDVSGVTDMSYMFSSCGYLKTLNVSGWDTSALDLSAGGNAALFSDCSSLAALTLGLNTDKGKILNSIPKLSENWYYIAQGLSAGHPLDYGSARTGSVLFTAYDPDTMAGTWTLALPPASGVKITDPNGIDITGKTVTIHTTGYQLKAEAEPAEASQIFTWTTGDTSIASVDANGNVTFLKARSVTVTAAATDGSGQSASVTLTNVPLVPLATAVSIFNTAGTDITGQTLTINTAGYPLKAAASPAEAAQNFTWTSSDTAAASVDGSGNVAFLKAGTVTVTAAATDGSGKSASVTLTYVPLADAVKILNADGANVTGKTLTVSRKRNQFTASASPAEAAQTFTWTSSRPSVAKVNAKGKVTFLKAGTVTITAAATDGSGKTASVTLKTNIKTRRVSIRNAAGEAISHRTIKVSRKTYQLYALDVWVKYASQDIKWTSSDKTIATVSKTGRVTFKKPGTVTITATATDGSGLSNWVKLKTAIKTTKVTIKDAAGRDVSRKTIKGKDKTVQLKAVAAPAKFVPQKFTWKTSDKSIAVVKAGLVTFKKAGTVKITATARDGSGVNNWVTLRYMPGVRKSEEVEIIEVPISGPRTIWVEPYQETGSGSYDAPVPGF